MTSLGSENALVRPYRRTATPCRPWILVLAAIGLVPAVACGGTNDASKPATSPPPSTTSASLSPDDAFDQALTEQLDGLTPSFIEGSRQASRTLCDNLTSLSTEPPDSTATTGAATTDVTPAMLVTAMYTGYSQPGVAAVVLQATSDHLCPEHADVIEQVLADR